MSAVTGGRRQACDFHSIPTGQPSIRSYIIHIPAIGSASRQRRRVDALLSGFHCFSTLLRNYNHRHLEQEIYFMDERLMQAM